MTDDAKSVTPPGDPAPEEIYRRIRRLVFRLVGPNDSMDDLVQTTMEAFLRSKHRHSGEGTLLAYADGIAVNVVRDFFRKQKRGNLLKELVAVRSDWPSLPAGPSEQTESRDKLRRLLEILQKLKPRYRTAYMLYSVDGRSVPEIARIERTTEGAVRTRLLRARREIHERARRDPVLAEWLAKTEKGS